MARSDQRPSVKSSRTTAGQRTRSEQKVRERAAQPRRSAGAPRKGYSVVQGDARSKRGGQQPRSVAQAPRKQTAKRATAKGSGAGAVAKGIASRAVRGIWGLATRSRTTMAVFAVVVVLLVGGLWDAGSHIGRTFGNITVGGLDVSGLKRAQIVETLQSTYGPRLEQARITVSSPSLSQAEGEEAPTWEVTADSLGASLDYEALADAALAQGRSDGGIPGRLALLFRTFDIPLGITFQDGAVDGLASQIDQATGDARVDASVYVQDGVAYAAEGHDGFMVDRTWLESALSEALVADPAVQELQVSMENAPSRISLEDAQAAAEAVNRAIGDGAMFSYGSQRWNATSAELGSWVDVAVEEQDNGTYALVPHINGNRALDGVIHNLDAQVTTSDMQVTFVNTSEGMQVLTQGTSKIPDMPTAVQELDEALFGQSGKAYSQAQTGAPHIGLRESNAPETLTFEQAADLGIVSVLASYTTDYSNYEGTENRNYNIHLAADMLNNTICQANGGMWSFNDNTGDTNQDPPFASAGSIVEGEYVDSIGGGICQVATTIFNAVYEAGLDIVTRWNHTLYIGSYPDGRDAAVSYPDLDLVWQNNLQSDVLLKMSYTDSTVTATLWGVATGYQVSTEPGTWEEGEKYGTVFEVDDSLAEGYYYLKTYGIDGSRYSVTRTVTDAQGNLVSVKTFGSLYQPKDEVYVVGPGTDTEPLKRDTSEDDSSDLYGNGAGQW